MSGREAASGTPGEVFRVFLKLGLTSFGGPVAHLGYFRAEFVARRRWLGEEAFADLVALCLFLPGPASSQLGFALGLLRGGPLGALAAWCGFTLPSALLMVLFAAGVGGLSGPVGTGVIHGLKLVAVAVIAQAVWSMSRNLAPDRERAGIAVAAVLIVTVVGGPLGQVSAIAAGALAGLWLFRQSSVAREEPGAVPLSRPVGAAVLAAFVALLLGLPLLARTAGSHVVDLFAAFYRAGALVFGGGHVVLPVLETAVVPAGWIGPDAFLAGYGAAQAMPGPLFTFAAYLGAAMPLPPTGWAGAALCLIAIFLPGLLLVTGVLPFWRSLKSYPLARAAMQGTNAAVIGILAAALYDPVWTGAVLTREDFAAALLGFALLTLWQAPPWAVVLLLGSAGPLLTRVS